MRPLVQRLPDAVAKVTERPVRHGPPAYLAGDRGGPQAYCHSVII